jgi:hypothetical protein
MITYKTIYSAEYIIEHIKNHTQWPCPSLVPMDDYLIFLWLINKVTYAISITDDEFGYVIRRDKKEVAFKDSIPLVKIGDALAYFKSIGELYDLANMEGV